ncbi:hypothetical protein RB195_004267 [Necator americanus]|uniref:Myotubularin phosphatase domain-containing protein n=1 Tax=Necator americanus TaxID=51031 RepID=A0ABR1BH40_NECAM
MSASNTFHSYIDDQSPDDTKTSKEVRVEPPSPGSSHDLLEGEIECAFCEHCSFVWPFSENGYGRVVCTNFRLRFEPSVKTENTLPTRFKAFSERYDVPLCSIHSVHYTPVKQNQSFYKKRFIHISKSLSSLEIVSSIRLQLKDFRVITIDLRDSQNAANLLNQILFFSRPLKMEKVIQAGAHPEWCSKLSFNDANSWEAELRRCGHGTSYHWRVCSQIPHGARQFVHSYPMYFVVPADIVQYDLGRMAEHWQLSRFPVWVWSSLSGASLLRSSNFEVNWEAPQLNDKVADCVRRATKSGEPPHKLSLNDEITVTKIASSYDRLRRLCSIDSYEHFASRNKDWLARINHTGWLQLVSYCLTAAGEAVDWLTNRGRSVIIYETNGLDVSAVVSSIVQICCDQYYRILIGLESLIAKDWIALGHPFAQRLLGIPNGDSEAVIAPTFLLFLDCLAQLIRLYPMQFAYSQHTLIALWDLSLTGMVPAFTSSSVADQLGMQRCGGPFPLERFFHESYTKLFVNFTNMAAVAVQNATDATLIEDVIRPPRSVVNVQLWKECYLRWIPPANTKRGGSLFTDLAIGNCIKQLPASRILDRKLSRPNVDLERISSAYPYSDADVDTHCGFYSNRDDTDTISISSMTLSTSSNLTVQDDKLKHRASVPVLGGIPEALPRSVILRHDRDSTSSSKNSSFRLRYFNSDNNKSGKN